MVAKKESEPVEARSESRFVRNRPSLKKRIIVLIIVIVVVVAAVFGASVLYNKTTNAAANAKINTNEYQAVFLTNGQVYFGKLDNVRGKYLELSNIYYLQVDQSIQSGTTTEATAVNNNSNVQLIKLGNELHGPEDKMQVSSDQVLFWENLKNDGKVAQAISSYKKSN